MKFRCVFLDFWPHPGPGRLPLDSVREDIEFAGVFASVASVAVIFCFVFCLGLLFTTVFCISLCSRECTRASFLPHAYSREGALVVSTARRISLPETVSCTIELYSTALEFDPHACLRHSRDVDDWCNSLTLSLRNLTTDLGRDRKGLERKDLSHLTPAIPPQKTKPGIVPFGRLQGGLLMPS